MTPFLVGPGKVRYSSVRCSNSKWILLEQTNGYIHLYSILGQFVEVLPKFLRTDTEVVFSWDDPDTVYYTGGNQLWRYHLVNKSFRLVASFPDYSVLTGYGAEGDITRSGYLALCGVKLDGTEWVFSYNINTGHIGTPYNPGVFDGRKVTESGKIIISRDGSGIVAIVIGTEVQLTEADGHACPSTYQGKDVLLWCTNGRARGWINALEMVEVDNPSVTKILFDLGKKDYAMQLSKGPGDSVIMCLYNNPLLPNQIWQVPLNEDAPILLDEWRAVYRNYDSSPKASYSDGVGPNGGHVFYNVDDGSSNMVWGFKMDGTAHEAQPKNLPIYYGDYADKAVFRIQPQLPCPTCGSTIKGIYEDKV